MSYRHTDETYKGDIIMARVVVKILGQSDLTEATASTIGDLKSQLGLETHAASINGQPADNNSILSDDSLVTFSKAVKGGY